MNTVSVSIIKNNPVVYIFKSYMIECIGIVVRLDTCQYPVSYTHLDVYKRQNLDSAGPSVGERIYTLVKILYWLIRVNFVYYIAMIPGMFGMLLEKKQ